MRYAYGWNAVMWLDHVEGPANSASGCTPWFSGMTAPTREGWFDRMFVDGCYRQWWDGAQWSHAKGGPRHWRQVGDYPCWRGLLTPNVKFSGERSDSAGMQGSA